MEDQWLPTVDIVVESLAPYCDKPDINNILLWSSVPNSLLVIDCGTLQ